MHFTRAEVNVADLWLLLSLSGLISAPWTAAIVSRLHHAETKPDEYHQKCSFKDARHLYF